MSESSSRSRTKSGYMRALEVARVCKPAGISMPQSASRVRSLPPAFAPFCDQNAGSSLAKLERERKPYDAASDNNHVPSLHFSILEDLQIEVRQIETASVRIRAVVEERWKEHLNRN